jgi:methionyl-tRNA synthetase
MTQPKRRILVTAALPYANGPIHIGHLVEYIQTDIWARFQRLRGHDCVFVCADDTHGTAIMKSARQAGISEDEFIAQMSQAHQRDFARFDIRFDHYGSTHSHENRLLCERIWAALLAAGLVARRPVVELFDPDTGESLPDRFVKGRCPVCGAPDQYGDNCDKCASTYRAQELVDPISTISGKPPVEGQREHFFVEIEALHEFLTEWTQNRRHLQEEVTNYLAGHFLHQPLRDWDVSRPAPYFGFDIPGTDGQHFWYVWFDAPIGYIASTWQWCKAHGQVLEDWWNNPATEIHHFLGKDIQYFHCLFWPAMLKTAGFSLPTRIHIHGFLTVNGEKMSKTKGTFVKAETYLAHLDPSFLRYYYAAKLGPRLDDLDLNIEELVAKTNADLVGKVVNLASRTAKFIEGSPAEGKGLATTYPDDEGRFVRGAARGEAIAAAYEECDYARAMRLVMELADEANAFVEAAQPWSLRHKPEDVPRLQAACTIALNLFRQIAVYLAPVLPRLAEQAGALVNQPITGWHDALEPLVNRPVAKFQHLLQRIELQDVQAMIDDSKISETSPAAPPVVDDDGPLAAEPLADLCTIDDFTKIDLRVARVVAAEDVAEANKLLKLTLSLGGDHRRTVFAGIKQAYKPADLVGRLVVMVANLTPRQMKFGLSEGMVCASGRGGTEVFLLGVDCGAKPGQRVH